jgi:hypothetical protein
MPCFADMASAESRHLVRIFSAIARAEKPRKANPEAKESQPDAVEKPRSTREKAKQSQQKPMKAKGARDVGF